MSLYDKIAAQYDERYSGKDFDYVSAFLKNFRNKKTVLEIGCGTFRWAKYFSGKTFGIDASLSMLKTAKEENRTACALAENLPFENETFDFVYIVNALHQFGNKKAALSEAGRVTKRKSELVIITPDFYSPNYQWYIYEYFKGTYEKDKKRFLHIDEIKNLLYESHFTEITVETIHVASSLFSGAKVLKDKFLQKHNTSQLAALSVNEYNEGIRKIRDEINRNALKKFETNIPVVAFIAKKIR